jgi:hypothetical protein
MNTQKRSWLIEAGKVQQLYGEVIGPLAISVYLALARYADRAGYCFPSVRRVAAETGMSRDSVLRSLARLMQAGLVRVQHRYRQKEKQSNGYFLSPAVVVANNHVVADSDHPSRSQRPPVVADSDHPSRSQAT